MTAPDVILKCEESQIACDLVPSTFRQLRPHPSRDVVYDFLLFRLRESINRGEWDDVPAARIETVFATAQRTAWRLTRPRMEAHS